MCGRYQRRADKQKIAESFELSDVDGLYLELAPDYNVAPQTMQPVVIWDDQYGSRTLHNSVKLAASRRVVGQYDGLRRIISF
jgi:putative SOS response-associated peptidase YedK